MIIRVLEESLPVSILVEPIIVERSRVKLLNILFSSNILYFFVGE